MTTTTTQPVLASNAQRYRVILAGICALILTVGLARFAYTPMLPIMRREAGLSDVAGGWLATFNYLGYISGALLAAFISDLRVKFRIYRVGLVVGLVSTWAMGMTDNPMLWAVLRLVSGGSSTAGMLLASGLVLNWLIRHQHRPELGLHFAGVGLGIVVSGLAVALTAPHLAWHEQWVALGWLGLLFFLPAWAWMPSPPATSKYAAPVRPTAGAQRWLRLLLAAYFCAGFGYVISATFIVAILEKLPILTGRGGWVWVVVGLAAVPSSFVWDRVAQRLGGVMALLLAYGLQLVSVLLPVCTDHVGLNMLSAALYGVTFVGIVSLSLTLIGRRFPDNPAKAMARLTVSYGVAQVLAPAMAGYIAQATGSYRGALLVTAVVLAVGMGLLVALKRVRE
jgi:MFS family permease